MLIHFYVKECQHCGLKYCGKTQKSDPFKYAGSGKYWKIHLRKHSIKNPKTLEVHSFRTEKEITLFALSFSKDNNIVESDDWANLRAENGTDGNPTGWKPSEETLVKFRSRVPRGPEYRKACSIRVSGKNNPMFGKKRPKTWREEHSAKMRGREISQETKEKMRKAKLGKKHTKETLIKMSNAHSGENNAMFGRKHSEESKAKMSASQPKTHKRNR